VRVFIGLTFLFSSIVYLWIFFTGSVHDVGFIWMWSPGTAAILTQLIFRDRLRDFGWRLPKPRFLVWGYLIVILYAGAIYGVTWISGLGEFTPLPIEKLLVYLTAGMVLACFAGLGEEIGWRGFLVPELMKLYSPRKAALISGGIWAVWHYPAILFGDYNSPTPIWYQLVTFTITVLGMAILTAWLRIRSGSLWPSVVWHGAQNLFVQQIFLSMTLDTGLTDYIVYDFGIGLTIAFLIIGIISWAKLGNPSGQMGDHLNGSIPLD
jgi:membrane protease YdiL (CAAX protease family)